MVSESGSFCDSEHSLATLENKSNAAKLDVSTGYDREIVTLRGLANMLVSRFLIVG